jgi:hypothetical protein
VFPFLPADARTDPEVPREALRRRLADAPAHAGLWNEIGLTLWHDDKERARTYFQRALRAEPTTDAAWSNLGALRGGYGDANADLRHLRRAMALAPSTPIHLFNKAVVRTVRGDVRGTLPLFDRLIRLAPDVPRHLWARALVNLYLGDYAQGFTDYECRFDLDEFAMYPRYRGPLWEDGPLDGKIVFVTTEQGVGDTLLAARYLPLLKARGAHRVVVETRPELKRLVERIKGVDRCVPPDPAPPPIYHVRVPLMSLPGRFATRVDAVPPPVRLAVPDDARAKARRLLGPGDGRLRVGIVWSGNTAFPGNAHRAVTLDRFLPFLDVPGVAVYSLQKGPPEAELEALPPGTPITALGPHLDDFADTAAIVEALDLVIMTDSSVAHLAGTLGTPVWNLLQFVSYWIYGQPGPATPWYASMRLYRQGAGERWEPVFAEVLADLRALARSPRPRSALRETALA